MIGQNFSVASIEAEKSLIGLGPGIGINQLQKAQLVPNDKFLPAKLDSFHQ